MDIIGRSKTDLKEDAVREQIKKLIFLAILSTLVLAACGGGGAAESDAILTEAAQIAIEGLTQTAQARPTNTSTPQPTATPTEVPTATATATTEGGLPSPTPTTQSINTGNTGSTGNTTTNSNAPCLRASFETETVPDGSRFYVNEVFTKSWRLKNTGSCTWDANFNVVWVDGDLMNADSANAFTDVPVAPNEYVSVEVTMQGPPTAGTYKGYWMLRSSSGEYFGVGINGNEWFWVEIETIPTD
jgi:hypothetical protein